MCEKDIPMCIYPCADPYASRRAHTHALPCPAALTPHSSSSLIWFSLPFLGFHVFPLPFPPPIMSQVTTPYEVFVVGHVCEEAKPEGPAGPPIILPDISVLAVRPTAGPITQESCFATCAAAFNVPLFYFAVFSDATMTQCYCCQTCGILVTDPNFTVRDNERGGAERGQ